MTVVRVISGLPHLIELAVAGGAEFIVTRNLRDLKQMEMRLASLRVQLPKDFLKALR